MPRPVYLIGEYLCSSAGGGENSSACKSLFSDSILNYLGFKIKLSYLMLYYYLTN